MGLSGERPRLAVSFGAYPTSFKPGVCGAGPHPSQGRGGTAGVAPSGPRLPPPPGEQRGEDGAGGGARVRPGSRPCPHSSRVAAVPWGSRDPSATWNPGRSSALLFSRFIARSQGSGWRFLSDPEEKRIIFPQNCLYLFFLFLFLFFPYITLVCEPLTILTVSQ